MKFKVVGTDPDSNTTLTYTTDNLPTLATLDLATGQFTWTPTPGQLGDYHINFTVSDGELTASTQALIKVALAPQNPTLNLDLTPSFPTTPGQQVIVQTQATGLADITNITATVDGKPVTIDSFGRFTFTPTTPGKFVVSATATDADGRVGNSSTVIKVRDPLDHTAPVVQFAPGLDGDKLTSVTKIIGTVNDPNLDSWVLEEATFGSSNWSAIATGNQSTDGVLAQFDPTQLINGFYQLRLTATSIGGQTSSTQIEVEADSVTKVGDYHRSETDFSLNLGGANFNLVRSYDSLNQNTQGAFGYGWELNTQSQIQTNVQTTGNEQFGVYNSLRAGSRLYLNLPTGERVGFTFTPQQHIINGLTYYTPAWVADSGVNYTLQSADAKLTKSGSGFYDLVTGDAYNPASGHFTGSEYTLTAADGTVYNLSTSRGITDEIASNGVHLYFSDSGITSSTGDTVQFVEDSQGRLTQITAPDGSLEVYGYDSQGNLVSARNLANGESHRYGYSLTDSFSHLLTLVTGTPGTSGSAITYSSTPQISPVIADLGSTSTFSSNTTTGNLISGKRDDYTISLRDSELQSAASSQVLVEVEVDGSGLNVPVIDGLTPLATRVNANSADALYAISREGLNLIEVSSTSPTAYSLHVSIAGDVNHDGLVDGTDAQLLAGAVGSKLGDANYNSTFDLNHDGVIDATDVQILGSNYGFTANRAPVVSPTTVLTHTDLSTIVGLDKLATDPEGSSIFYRVVNPVDGTVTLTLDGHSALFKPIAGYSGSAGFDIVADDGFSSSAPTHVTVNVSNAGLENLDFEGRNPKLGDGGSTDLVVYGDFADQSHVLLSGDYLQFGSDNTAVASVSKTGHITGLTDGVSVLSASSHGITAVTALRVGTLSDPTTQDQLNVATAEDNGLDLYPHAVTLITGVDRRLLVRLNGEDNSPQLQAAVNGTRYFVSNPNVISVTPDGVITSLHNGVANVTVVYGGAEAVVPVQVENPHLGATILGTDGGVVEGSDGSMVMLGQGALSHDANVNITPLTQNDLTLTIPDQFGFEGAFKLDVGSDPLNLPAQLAIRAPLDLAAGTQVFLLRQTELPDTNGTEQPTWMIDESAMVGADGMIRTQSPPWPGVDHSGTYSIVVPHFQYSTAKAVIGGGLVVLGTALTALGGLMLVTKSPKAGAIIAVAGSAIYSTGLYFLDTADQPQITTLTIPTVGLPYTTTTGVHLNLQQLNSGEIPTVNVDIPPAKITNTSPTIQQAQLKYEEQGALIYLQGTNFGTSSSDEDNLTVTFHSHGQQFQGFIVKEKSDLSKGLIVVQPDDTFALRDDVTVGITNKTTSITGTEPQEIPLPVPDCVELALAPLRLGNKVDVFNALDAANIVNSSGSYNLLQASIPVTTPGIHGDLRYAAATSDASRAYVPLELSQKIAVIDIVGQRQIDVNPTTSGIDSISLDPGSMPSAIVIGPEDEYAYVADRRLPAIYVIDIDPNSPTYNQRIQTINVNHAPNGIHQLALSHDSRRLFATAPGGASSNDGEILVFDVDLNDQGQPGSKWNHQIGSVKAGSELEGISSTADANKMLFTNGGEDGRGFGVLTINNNDANSFTATTTYTQLGLGSVNDYFDVNEGVAVTITSDGKYAFVAGRNGRLFGSGIPSIDDPKAGSNVGIIQDPLGDHPQLIAATRPIPMGLTNGLSLLSNDHYLYASYPGIGGTFVFDVQHLEKDLAAATPQQLAQLASTPIDDVFSDIDLGADVKTSSLSSYSPSNDKNAPLITGGAPYSVTPVSTSPVINLQPITVSDASTLKPTFKWNFNGEGEDTTSDCPVPPKDEDIQEVDLYVSVFGQNQGLLPYDRWSELKDPLVGVDYNRNRILTATWKDGKWNWIGGPDGGEEGSNTEFTLPDDRKLTAGQTYHWTVEAITASDVKTIVNDQTFNTPLRTSSDNTFSGVTILTRGAEINGVAVDSEFHAMAQHIAQLDVPGVPDTSLGLVLDYDSTTGKWDKDGTTTEVTVADLNNDLGRPLVLLPGWSAPLGGTRNNSGFSEAAADTFYASLVGLDQMLATNGGIGDGAGNIYDAQGKLIRNQGELFNSALHFIGFGQGAVINDEIIQRLGTDYPLAGGVDKDHRDLQMTTIDPQDFKQNSLGIVLKSLNEPQIKIWSNITFADNYYQTVADPNGGKTYTRNGRSIPEADLDVNLNNWAGFTSDDKNGGPHIRALAWYAGTLNLTGSTIEPLNNEKIYRRLGDLEPTDRETTSKTWYTPYPGYQLDHSDNQNAPSEGIGTGWFYSVLGGGKDKRQAPKLDQRVSVSEDNTAKSRMEGDFAIPTLFNGNFDAITNKLDGQNIPGWSFYNGANDLSQTYLVDVNQITDDPALSGELDKLQVDRSQHNYAVELNSGDSITHNRFVVPDWGVLRFDLHIPPTTTLGTGGQVLVTLQAADGSTASVSSFVNLEAAAATTATSNSYLENSQRIGYGTQGFETFTIDIPNELRGKLATIKFEADGGEVYLDNIFFKSQSLIFGNPTEARTTGSPVPNQYYNNYLLEKPQYTVSYSSDSNISNWSSWQVNQTWLGTERPSDNFFRDPDLDSLGLISAKDTDYDRPLSDIVPGDPTVPTLLNPGNGKPYKLAPGHLTPNADRSRNLKDAIATFATSNILPENEKHNSPLWLGLEDFTRNLVTRTTRPRREVYVFAGGVGEKDPYTDKANINVPATSTQPAYAIQVPSHLWKVLLILDRPGMGIQDITASNATAFAVYTENALPQPGSAPFTRWNDGGMQIMTVAELETILNNDPNNQVRGIQYNFLSNLPDNIRTIIKTRPVTVPTGSNPADTAFLMAAPEISSDDSSIISADASVWHNGITKDSSLYPSTVNFGSSQIGSSQIGFNDVGRNEISSNQLGISQISSGQISTTKVGSTEIGVFEDSLSKTGLPKVSITENSSSQINSLQVNFSQPTTTTQVNSTQINSSQVISFQINPSKISFPSSVSSQQLFSIHTLTPETITTINNTAQTLWNTLLAPQTPFNINLQLTDSLAKGQLAEAIVTKYDSLGRPIGGTIEVDPTANGLGWFIDPNITDQGKFSQTLSSTASRATTNSDAYGHYDLLTALLHEMAHLAGFISGYSGFDRHVQTIAGSQLFIGDNFTAPLTNDGSHLDPKTYAYDLLNPTLTPGVRELPSQIDVEILKEVRSADNVAQITPTQAALTSSPLTDILNGKFDINDTTDPNYGWTTRGAATILSKEAVLTEDSPLNSEFKQTFTVPQGAKYLEFTLKDTTLGNDSADSPGDAFEVALLDANEKTSLVDTANGLTRTDALLNIQHDGTAYLSNQVILPATVSPNSTLSLHSPMTFKVDVSNIQPGTTATLYFDLLGFGNRDAKVTIDDVELLNSDPVPPVANNDTATTDAGKQVTINVLANDTSNQTIDPTRIAIATNPTNGNIAVNKDGTLAYTPNNNFVGTDTFTYTVIDSSGTASNPATVTVTVNDVAPTITDLPVPKKVYQLDPTNFSATATTTGDNHLTYTWDFGDGTNPTQGATVQHTFTQSGEYQTTLTVVDAIGLKDTKTVTVYVGSTAPTQGDDPNLPPGFGDVAPQITDLPVPKKVYELDPTNFSATATSPIGEPLTYTWNFGDGTDAVVGQSVSHTFVASGQYNATLTVTDDFGFSDTKTVTVYVGSTAPTNDGSSLPDWNGTWDDIFRQFGNMS